MTLANALSQKPVNTHIPNAPWRTAQSPPLPRPPKTRLTLLQRGSPIEGSTPRRTPPEDPYWVSQKGKPACFVCVFNLARSRPEADRLLRYQALQLRSLCSRQHPSAPPDGLTYSVRVCLNKEVSPAPSWGQATTPPPPRKNFSDENRLGASALDPFSSPSNRTHTAPTQQRSPETAPEAKPTASGAALPSLQEPSDVPAVPP